MAEHALLFMNLENSKNKQITGESVVANMTDWIDIDDWSWKLSRATEQDNATPSVLSFSKVMDRATPNMLQAMFDGEQLKATIQLQDSSLQLLQLKLILKRVRITDYTVRTQVSDKRAAIEEDWVFDYGDMDLEFRRNANSAWMRVSLNRPPGSSTEAGGKKKEVMALAKDMSVQDLDALWKEVKDLWEMKLKGPPKPEPSKEPGATG